MLPRSSQSGGKVPASLPDWLPGLGNTYRFIFHNRDFLDFARKNIKGQGILKFWLGPKGVYLVTGAKNSQAVLRNSGNLSSDELIFMVLAQLDAADQKDIDQFRADKSGRSHIPQSPVGPGGRIWAQNHRIFTDNLSTTKSVGVMIDKFLKLFTATLEEQFPIGESKSLRLYSFLKQEMARCAIISMSGEEILKQNPGFIDAMWEFDTYVFPLVFGVPRLLYPKAYAARDLFHEMGEKFLTAAWEKFDWSSSDADADWEPIFGTRFHRTHSKFTKDRGFALRTRSGMHLGTVWAQNANSLPVTCWALIELIKDKSLFTAVRAEVSTALDIEGKLDVKKVAELPLLQSVFFETLRLHIAVNITRQVTEEMVLDGYTLKKGHLVQTPSLISHLDESTWSDPGHPASEFWAERHITYVDRDDGSGNKIRDRQFSLAGRAGNFFPFGGGISICAGRHFAKQEIMAAIALVVSKFDFELEGYVAMDGKKSERGPLDDVWYCGTAAMPPDRDLMVKMTRV
ncbi:cytochrome P450 [Stipitochalara longipes BDJ]|nr:cytochrome P450 [Stipitochalara longipes BDJ]